MGDQNACGECGFTTSNFEAFTEHITKHEEGTEKMTKSEKISSEKKVNEWNVKNEQDSNTINSINCDMNILPLSPNTSSDGSICQQSPPSGENQGNPDFIRILPPARNSNIKGEKQLLTCPHCKFQTFMSQHMKSHLDAHERHQGQMYQCDICHMQFSQKANMHRHRMRHTGVKPYPCKYCDKKFFRKDQMQEHSMTHIKTGVDFDCPVTGCDVVCSQHSMLRTHLDDVHQISSFKSASCKRCTLIFTNSRRLLLHYQTKHEDGGKYSIGKGSGKSPNENNKKNLEQESKDTSTPALDNLFGDIRLKALLESSSIPVTPTKKRGTKRGKSSVNDVKNDNFNVQKEIQDNMLSMLTEAALNAAETNQNQFDSLLKHENFTDNFALQVKDLLGNFTQDDTSKTTLFNLSTPPSTISNDVQSHSSSDDSTISMDLDEPTNKLAKVNLKNVRTCDICNIIFIDPCVYLLHKGLHDEMDPYKCNLCGVKCKDVYTFSCHIINAPH